MQFKSVLLASSLAALAYAAESSSEVSSITASKTISAASSCTFETATATAQTDLDKYNSCEALHGDLHITGSLASAALDDVKAVYGSIVIANASDLTSFSATSLGSVTGRLSLTALTRLSSLNIPNLDSVGQINFVTLPALSAINLNQGTGITKINSLYISDTVLESLEGFDVETLDTFNVNNNRLLNSITSSLRTVKTKLEVSYNSDEVEVSFDQLQWANNITFRDVASVSMQSLFKVNDSLGFINNSITEIDLPMLKEVGSSLSITANNELTDIDISNLTEIDGGFVISNNTALLEVTGFDKLSIISGAVILEGSFNNVSLPVLKRVSGGVTVQSDGEDFSCDTFDELSKKKVIEGNDYACKATGATDSESDSESESGSSGSTKSGSSSGATASGSATSDSEGAGAAPAVAQAGTLLAAVGSFIFAML